jgi:glucose/arabinose dehydrogenase
MVQKNLHWLLALHLGCLLFACPYLQAQEPPREFSSIPVGTNWNQPVGLTFSPSGKMFVWEKAGKVWVTQNDTKPEFPLLDISEEVGDWRDHGLLGFALDPKFEINGYIYLLYVVDRHYLTRFGTASYRASSNEYYRATIGRLTRYQVNVSDPNAYTLLPESRRILLGESMSTGIPILSSVHGVGSLVFGSDGTLLVSCGDGASAQTTDVGSAQETYYEQALADGIITPQQNVGAYRAQQIDVMSGKILRLDPTTGNGLPSNPYYESGNPRSARSRVWALGLRNPYRMSKRPDTGSQIAFNGNPGVFYIGDVGWSLWEEINVLNAARTNFGWPVYEGMEPSSSYNRTNTLNPYAPNPLYPSENCQEEFLRFNQLLQQANPGQQYTIANPCDTNQLINNRGEVYVHTRPLIDWRHRDAIARTGIFRDEKAAVANLGSPDSPVAGDQFTGDCAIGGVWYTDESFPPEYRNRYYFADYTQGWIKVLTLDGFDKPIRVDPFIDQGANVVCMAVSPVGGGLYYIHLGATEPFAQEIRKIVHSAGRPPVAVAIADKTYGPGPLTVQFSANQSFDPNGFPISYHWDFGDGSPSSTLPNPRHQFFASGNAPIGYQVTLQVTNSLGLNSSQHVWVSLNNTPPQVTITSPVNHSTYPLTVDSDFELTATVSDAEHSPIELKYEWQTALHHNNHVHEDPVDTLHSTSTTISPMGCDGETYYYTVHLTVTDPAGLYTTRQVTLLPDCNAYLNIQELTATADDASVTLHWKRPPNAFDEVMVVAKAGDGIRTQPVGDGSLYLANSDFMATSSSFDGGKVVYKGRDTVRTVTRLTNHQTYFFRIFTRMGTTWSVGLETSAIPSVVTAAKEEPNRLVTVFPNPARELITIGMDGYAPAHSAQIVLFNGLGSTATQLSYLFTSEDKATGKAAYQLPIGHLPRGIYLLQIRLNNHTWHRKIVLN